MQVFISYDFEDRDKFDDLALAFGQKGLKIFDPRSLVGTRPLAEQLRDAIGACTACVFVATHRSVNSAWCAAELGAFWGSGKSVVIYVADTSLSDDQLPKQFTGWLLVRSLFKAVGDIEALGHAAPAATGASSEAKTVGSLSIEEFKALIASAMEGSRRSDEVADLIFQLGGNFDYDEDEERFARLAGRGLSGLLGEVLPKVVEMKVKGWRYAFDAATSTGSWLGYGQVSEQHANGMLQLYKKCLVIKLDDDRRIVAAALTKVVGLAHRALGLSSWTIGDNVLRHVGSVQLGVAVPEE